MRKLWTYPISYIANLRFYKGMGEQRIYQILNELGLVDDANRPIQKYVDEGYLELRSSLVEIDGKNTQVYETLAVDPRGLYFVMDTLDRYLRPPNMTYITAKKKKEKKRRL